MEQKKGYGKDTTRSRVMYCSLGIIKPDCRVFVMYPLLTKRSAEGACCCPLMQVQLQPQYLRVMASELKRGQKYCQQPAQGGLIRAHEQLGMEQKPHNLCLLRCVSEVCNKTVCLITQETNRHTEKLKPSNRN